MKDDIQTVHVMPEGETSPFKQGGEPFVDVISWILLLLGPRVGHGAPPV